MNYRHAYHAGNHAEVFKHAVLVLLIEHLRRKATPFTVLDTHAGTGMYDLRSPEAHKTTEAQDGIGRVIDSAIPIAATYLDFVRRLNPAGLRSYPGSPAIIQYLLRDNDRLIACELHEEDAASLRVNFRHDARISIHRRDGYEALNAFVPPPTKRGLVFVDPPFEGRDEFELLGNALNSGIRKWPTGIFAAWYPIKDGWRAGALRSIYRTTNPPTLSCEFLRKPVDGATLAGSGMVICNPPWQFEQSLVSLCKGLIAAFAAGDARQRLDWWVPES